MARKAEREKTKDGLKLKIVNPNAAGINELGDGSLIYINHRIKQSMVSLISEK